LAQFIPKFNGIIAQPLSIYSVKFMTVIATVFSCSC